MSLYLSTPSAQAVCDTGSISKWSLTGFPSPRLAAKLRLKNQACPAISPHLGWENNWIHIFPNGY